MNALNWQPCFYSLKKTWRRELRKNEYERESLGNTHIFLRCWQWVDKINIALNIKLQLRNAEPVCETQHFWGSLINTLYLFNTKPKQMWKKVTAWHWASNTNLLCARLEFCGHLELRRHWSSRFRTPVGTKLGISTVKVTSKIEWREIIEKTVSVP